MRKALFIVAVLATLLLGVIAAELYPIARIAATIAAPAVAQQETDDQKRARITRELRATQHDAELFIQAAEAAQASSPRRPGPTPRSAPNPSSNTR
jgi:hypothetical protein